MTWDGKGKHPVLQKTREEILQMNVAVTEKHAEDTVESAEAKPQPSFQEEVIHQTTRSQQNQEQFIERLADNLLTDRKS